MPDHTHKTTTGRSQTKIQRQRASGAAPNLHTTPQPQLRLHKIVFHLEACMHKSIILVLPSPACIAHNSVLLLHDYCAVYDPPRPPPAYAIHHTILAMAISCEGQDTAAAQEPRRRTPNAGRHRQSFTAFRSHSQRSDHSHSVARAALTMRERTRR